MAETIDVKSLPKDLHYSNIPVEYFDSVFSKAEKVQRSLQDILISGNSSVIFCLNPQFFRYEGGHTEKSIQRLRGLGEELPQKILNPRVMGITQTSPEQCTITEVRDFVNLSHPPYWLINGSGKTFYLRDNQPAGRSVYSGEWLPNPVICKNKYLCRLEGEESFYEVFNQFKEKRYKFENEVLPKNQ